MDGENPRLVHLAAALVGAPDPGLALRDLFGDPRGQGGARRVPALRRAGSPAGPGRPRYLVLLCPVAVLDSRMAGRHTRSAPLLPDLGPGHGLRHPVLLGLPDDYD